MPNSVEQPVRASSPNPIGVWIWHVQTGIVQADKSVCDYYSVPSDEGETGLPIAAFLAGIHEEDRPRIINRIALTVMSGKPYREVYRVVHRTDGVRWIEAKGSCFRDADGRPAVYPGTIVDVTDPANEEPHTVIVENLMEAQQMAQLAKEPVLARLIEAVLIEAGRRLASHLSDNEGL